MRNRFRAPSGRGRGWLGSAPTFSPEQEKEMLRSQARDMQDQLEQITNRLNELDS